MSTQRKQFPFSEFESRWQQHWLDAGAFHATNPDDPGFDPARPKYYILDMFPYPSGDGLHVGHVEGYTATDILARHHRMRGFNVLHPMGWDAFGLPAEQFAIKTGQHPRVTTARNIGRFRSQLQALGFSYDWQREFGTTDPGYFRWTQWIFLQLYNAWFNPETNKAEPISTYTGDERDSVRLAYVAEMPVNWCPELGTVLANEEIVDGKSEVGGFPVERRPLRQWMLRITAFAERLIDGLEGLDWPDSIKLLQKNWIGRSEGALVEFQIADSKFQIPVFTTRPDTLFGATYMVLSPEHPLVPQITTPDQKDAVEAYQKTVGSKSDLERTDLAKEKTGVFTGAHAINPVNSEPLPVWIADYVLMGYGTGAIMAVPAHDERDFDFAQQFGLPVREVVVSGGTGGTGVTGGTGGTGVPPVKTLTPFFEKLEEIKIHERNLPHWEQDSKYYFVTWRLADSIPADVVKGWNLEADAWLTNHRQPLSAEEQEEFHDLFSNRIEEALDAGRGSCLLNDPAVASLVESALKHFDGDRYDLSAFVVMPNHVHVLFRLREGQDLAKTLHSWKSFTAHGINKALNRQGAVWQEEYFDRLIRDDGHFSKLVEYIVNNPHRAGLSGVRAYTGGTPVPPVDSQATGTCFSGEGVAVNSGFLDGLPTAEAKRTISAWLEEHGLGRATINYKLRDWLFSRQRYWGEPFPIVWEGGRHRAISEGELPVVQPEMDDFKPTGTPEPPLSKAREWVQYTDKAERETNTMPQWAGSCWYYLRFCDPENSSRFIGTDAENYWMASAGTPGGVDLYVGGTEHAVLHLLYARFWHKVLFDLGHLSTPEPFQRLVNQGMILGPDGQKMSKSRGNVITPDSVIAEYGADSLRLYEMFMGPLEQMKPWSIKGVEGVYRFLARVWRLGLQENQEGEWVVLQDLADIPFTSAQARVVHETIKKVTHDLGLLAFNTAISQMMVCTNEFVNAKPRPVQALRILLPLLSPFAPHLAEELWSRLGFEGAASAQPWPVHDESLLVESEIEIPVQVNGKVRDRIRVAVGATNEEVEAAARASAKVLEATAGVTIVKAIIVPGKLVNIVAKP
ncbi:MAG: class I tRNA ligase family protein [Verrucomicrobia bacterium]|nr:class I tRNA ligase family protein [Verrucomicrobiota bacterium]